MSDAERRFVPAKSHFGIYIFGSLSFGLRAGFSKIVIENLIRQFSTLKLLRAS
jgi:hypothetical protein